MDQELPSAPPITISDPNHPGALVDVLGGGTERDPWRPSRRALKIAGIVLLVLAIGLVPVLVLHHRSVESAADKASLARVALEAPVEQDTGFGDEGSTTPPLLLANNGPEAIRVVGMRVDREGYTHQHANLRIGSHESGSLPIAIETRCPERIGLSGPGGVLLDVVTARGAKTTVRVPTLDTSWAQLYQLAVKQTCHLYRPYESVLAELNQALVETKRVRLVVDLQSQAQAERQLVAVHAPDGIAVTVDKALPLVIARTDDPLLTVTFTLTVTDCAAARDLFPGPVVAPPVPQPLSSETGGESFGYGNSLLIDVRGDGTTATNVPLFLDGQLQAPFEQLVRTSCGS